MVFLKLIRTNLYESFGHATKTIYPCDYVREFILYFLIEIISSTSHFDFWQRLST
jgi:hypothetical protein